MNERIQELAEKSDCSIDGMGYGEGNLEKFAELIVEECNKVFKQNWNMGGSSLTISAIKKHFGVEE
jgi:hypothetical protein